MGRKEECEKAMGVYPVYGVSDPLKDLGWVSFPSGSLLLVPSGRLGYIPSIISTQLSSTRS